MHALFNLFKWNSVILYIGFILATLLSNKPSLYNSTVEMYMNPAWSQESTTEMTTAHCSLQVHCLLKCSAEEITGFGGGHC